MQALAYEEYQYMKARLALLEMLAESQEDYNQGRVADIAETFDELRSILS